jgi:hypothetical protein
MKQREMRQRETRQNPMKQMEMRQKEMRQNLMKQMEMRQKETRQNPMKQNPMKQKETRQNETAKSYSIISRYIGSPRLAAGIQYCRIKRPYVFCDSTNVELSARLPTSIHPQVSTTVLPQWMSTPSKPETFSRRGTNPPPHDL